MSLQHRFVLRLVVRLFILGFLTLWGEENAPPVYAGPGREPWSGVTALRAGIQHTCFLTAWGEVKCWGGNTYGQLGDGTTIPRLIPTKVSGLSNEVIDLAAGYGHTCALTAGSGVKCWGLNNRGQLGDGTITNRLVPVEVSGLSSGVIALTAGYEYTCGLTTEGGVKCWGYNSRGQLGDGTLTTRLTPVEVRGLSSGIIALAAGYEHTCALTTEGGVKCWGYNGYGQLGDGTLTQRLTPIEVNGLSSGIIALAAGCDHTCALTAEGGIKCWGGGRWGKLGDGTALRRLTPTEVSGLSSGVIALTAGYQHTCAVTAEGGVKCWGYNDTGQLGDGTVVSRLIPTEVSGLSSGFIDLVAGNRHTCALTAEGRIKCWGSNDAGQLGNGKGAYQPVPVEVNGLSSGIIALAAGNAHSCALTAGGGAKCWGSNSLGRLGDGTITDQLSPVEVSGLNSGVIALTAGYQHTCALTAEGGAKCWGGNNGGQLGDGTHYQRHTPVEVSGLSSGVIVLTTGDYHTCALTTGGGAKCWGYNRFGQLGNGMTTEHLTPVEVSGLSSGVTTLTLGFLHTCAVTAEGGVKCWGDNRYGQLGDGTSIQRLTPTEVSGLSSGIIALAAGSEHTCALTIEGGVKCWGSNRFGQLGDGTTKPAYLTLREVSGLSSGVTTLTAGLLHTCALTAEGGVKCWGDNRFGQMGDGTDIQRLTPTEVSGLSSGIIALAAGDYHTCALTVGGGVKCWGHDHWGQLGDGAYTTPGDVIIDPLEFYLLYLPFISRDIAGLDYVIQSIQP